MKRRTGFAVACSAGLVSAFVDLRAQESKPRIDDKSRNELWAVATTKLPTFPDLPALTTPDPGVKLHEVSLVWDRGTSRLWIYLPAGEPAKATLPCVFIAPAGSNLLFGMDLGDGDRVEHLPYVKAGFAVVAYEIEGACFFENGRIFEALWVVLRCFQLSCAGLQDARAALEYALARVPLIDPKRLFVAGHSSAATMALLFAAHEPRLKGCAAYAPIDDVRKRIGDENVAEFEHHLPGLGNFLVKSSPRTHEARLNCPLFLFHAKEDATVPFADSQAFVDRLRAADKKVTFETVPAGDHYQSMLEVGVPKAIEWLKALSASGAAKPDAKPGTSGKPKPGN